MATISKKKSMAPPKKKLKDMNIDEFMAGDLDSDSESSSKSGSISVSMNDKSASLKGKKNKSLKQTVSASPQSKKKKKGKEKKVTLAETLKDADPDFYEYLQGEDENLLNTLEDLSESDSNSETERKPRPKDVGSGKRVSKDTIEMDLLNMSSGDDSDEDDSQLHKPSEELEVASDDSELEDNETKDKPNIQDGAISVTHKMIEEWTHRFISSPSVKLLKETVAAFNGAVSEASGTNDGSVPLKYKIKGDSIFNDVVRMCLAHIPSALEKILQIPSLPNCKQTLSSKNVKWIKIKLTVKSYLSDVLKLLSSLSEPVMINTILKHVHKLTIVYVSFGKLAKLLLKKVIKMWSSGEETTRILAFLIINKMVTLQKDIYLETAIKKMYMAYVSNCKFVSPTTLPLINFMQRSLVEIFNKDESMSYQYAFVYIRQLAIHLRNAMTVKKKNTCQAVYNWQYIHCLGLWIQLLSSFPTDALKPLIYPLTQTVIGTIKLLPSSRFYPLRFHCIKFLNTLSLKTKTYIPTLPFLLDVFQQTDFNKRHKSVSSKPFNFAVILKFSKPQLSEKSFKDGLVDQLFEHLMESFNVHAHSVGFPELVIPSLLRLKDFIKKCKIANYCKQIKQIIDKMEEQSKFIVQKRKQSTLQLDDFQALRRWEEELESSPLRTFYTSWRKLRDRELIHGIANKEVVSGAAFDVPSIDRKTKKTATPEEREDMAELFDDMSDPDDDTRFLLKEERPKKENKKRKRNDDSDDDMDDDDYSDFDDEELEQLAKSASEDDESDEGDSRESEESDESESDVEIVDKAFTKRKSKDEKKENGKSQPLKTSKQSFKDDHEDDDDDSDDVVEDFVMSDSDEE